LADAATKRDENEAVLSFQKVRCEISTSNSRSFARQALWHSYRSRADGRPHWSSSKRSTAGSLRGSTILSCEMRGYCLISFQALESRVFVAAQPSTTDGPRCSAEVWNAWSRPDR